MRQRIPMMFLFWRGGQPAGRVADGRPAHLLACWQDDKVTVDKGNRRPTALAQGSRLGRQSSVPQLGQGYRCRGGIDYAEPIVC